MTLVQFFPFKRTGDLRIGDHMSDIRLLFGRPEHRYQAPGTVKIQSGQKLDVFGRDRCSNI